MNVRESDALVADLREMAGEGLRVVASYTKGGYDVYYVREDVEPLLESAAEDVHEDLVLQRIGREHLESLFGLGDLHCSMHRFEAAMAFHFVADEQYTGLYVSVDSDVSLPLVQFAERCESALA